MSFPLLPTSLPVHPDVTNTSKESVATRSAAVFTSSFVTTVPTVKKFFGQHSRNLCSETK
jgi:hypothetical protein